MPHPALVALATLRDLIFSAPVTRAEAANTVLGWLDSGWNPPNIDRPWPGGTESIKYGVTRECFAAI